MRLGWLAVVLLGCDGATEPVEDTEQVVESCDIPCQWSAAGSEGLCQVNLFCDASESAMYCAANANGEYECSCGAAAEAPPMFVSSDMCDIEGEARVCAAMDACANWTY